MPADAEPRRPLSTRPFDRFSSIRAKLGSVIVLAIAMTILIMYVAIGFALRKTERDRQFRELSNEARGIATFALTPSGEVTRTFLRAVGEQPSPVLVVDALGRPLLRHGGLPMPPTIERALAGYVDTGTVGRYEYFGVPIIRQGQVVGAIYLSHTVEGGGVAGAVAATFSFVRSVWWQFLLAGALAAVISLALARFLARGMTRPLRDMAAAARAMARGDYHRRVHPRTRDEVGQLAEAFNRMAGEMEGLERLRRELVANVSHELKTPISALRAHLENLLDGVAQPNPELLSVMLQQSERLSRLVEQLLELSLLESGEVPLRLEPVSLAGLAEQVVTEVRVARPDRDLDVRVEIGRDVPTVEADRERIHQVLFNLLDNAFRFTPDGGRVSLIATAHDGWCEIRVDDTGPGIAQEHLGLVFERFYRVDPARSRAEGGTGIGLAIARSVVDAHGGRIWAESANGGGASFRLVLPLGETGRADGWDDDFVETAHAPAAARSGTPSMRRMSEEAR